ncbi:glycerophosphodiester phosphodiesterase family protein [Sphingosinicella terrae]|uniref:glycerophosphodiester phosphodiesterase family protein n=1 Tax=Sphingosinicella terrae TaxID=2172047 RepID=UPI000E0DB765|nr:glycerophosphodiester phosphodiesterase family protein [Sphingosinicella terrae]
MPSSPSGRTDLSDPNGGRLDRLIAHPFAHRGLHGSGIVENSRAAFEAAIAGGWGIELDVQASRDGRAFVFHDYELDRLTPARGRLAETNATQLKDVRLRGTDEAIPSLEEALALIGGRAALLIEVKSPGRQVAPLSRAVADAIRSYEGPVAVMSFNPEIGRWFARHSPATLRGLVVTEGGRRWRGSIARYAALWRSRPHFLAYDIRDLPSRFADRQRARGLKLLTWTCRSDDHRATAALHADQIIFERQA